MIISLIYDAVTPRYMLDSGGPYRNRKAKDKSQSLQIKQELKVKSILVLVESEIVDQL